MTINMNREQVSCAICNNDNTLILSQVKSGYNDEIFNIVRCNYCGLVYVNPRQNWEQKKIGLINANFTKDFIHKSNRKET